MKNKIQLILVIIFMVISSVSMAQLADPGNGLGDPNAGGGAPVGGGAPIGSGLALVIGLGAVYASSKTFLFNTSDELQK